MDGVKLKNCTNSQLTSFPEREYPRNWPFFYTIFISVEYSYKLGFAIVDERKGAKSSLPYGSFQVGYGRQDK